MNIENIKNMFSGIKQKEKSESEKQEKLNINNIEKDFSLQNELSGFIKRWPILKFIDESLMNLDIENIYIYKEYENKKNLENINLKNIEYIKTIFKS